LGGNDQVFAAEGNDTVYGSTDHSYGGEGNDIILAADSSVDIINCGKGTDEVRYDDKPTVKDTDKGCEIKKPVS
jgi:hypothetical protein